MCLPVTFSKFVMTRQTYQRCRLPALNKEHALPIILQQPYDLFELRSLNGNKKPSNKETLLDVVGSFSNFQSVF